MDFTPELMAKFAEFMRQQQSEKAQLTINQLWESYAKWGEVNIKSWHTTSRVNSIPILKFFGSLTVPETTHAKADEYVAGRLKQPCKRRRNTVKPATVNRELAVLKACINWSIKRKLADINPLKGYEPLPEENDRDFYINEEDFARLLTKAKPLMRQALILAFETGMRRDEVRCLEWSEVNLKRCFIKLPANRTKAKRERTIPLSELAMRVLDSCPKYTGARYVFRHPLSNEDEPLTRSTFYDWFREAREAAGITGPKGQSLWVHTLRHSFCSLQAIEGRIPLRLIMSMVGHESKEVHDRYANMGEDHISLTKHYLDARRGLVSEKPAEETKPKGPSPLMEFLKNDEDPEK